MKTCPRCRESKPLSGFYLASTRSGGYDAYCKSCRSDMQKERHARNPQSQRVQALSRYGMTPASYDSVLASQGGKCAICGTDTPGGKGGIWQVDHDHSCCPGKRSCGNCVRGLLCIQCNVGLGYFRDNPSLLRSAIDYLND